MMMTIFDELSETVHISWKIGDKEVMDRSSAVGEQLLAVNNGWNPGMRCTEEPKDRVLIIVDECAMDQSNETH